MSGIKTYSSQIYANHFPLWSAIRQDPSSLGHRILSVAAEATESAKLVAGRLARQSIRYGPNSGFAPSELARAIVSNDERIALLADDLVSSRAAKNAKSAEIVSLEDDLQEAMNDGDEFEAFRIRSLLLGLRQELAALNERINTNEDEIRGFYQVDNNRVVEGLFDSINLKEQYENKTLQILYSRTDENGVVERVPINESNTLSGFLFPLFDDLSCSRFTPVTNPGILSELKSSSFESNKIYSNVNENEAAACKNTLHQYWFLAHRGYRSYLTPVVVVHNGTSYDEVTFVNDEPQNPHFVKLIGYDELGDPQEETIYITDDGVYESMLLWKHFGNRYENPSPAVVTSGTFVADVEVYANSVNLLDANGNKIFEKRCPFYSVALAENEYMDSVLSYSNGVEEGIRASESGLAGPLYTDISSGIAQEDNNDYDCSFFDSYFKLFYQGSSYRSPDLDDELIEESKELISSQILLDEFGIPFELIDYAFNYYDMKMYALDAQKKVHSFKLGNHVFSEHSLKRTKKIEIALKPLHHRCEYGEQVKIWTYHQILRSPIISCVIMRESPQQAESYKTSGIFTGEYLQQDKTWGPNRYEFSGNPSKELAEESWTDFSFYSDFAGDVSSTIGQWNFYCETRSLGGVTGDYVTLEDLYSSGQLDDDPEENKRLYWDLKERMLLSEAVTVTRHSTSVFCEYLQAEKTLDLEAGYRGDPGDYNNVTPIGLGFGSTGDKMKVYCKIIEPGDGNVSYSRFGRDLVFDLNYSLFSDSIFLDFENNSILCIGDEERLRTITVFGEAENGDELRQDPII